MKVKLNISWYGHPKGAIITETDGAGQILIDRGLAVKADETQSESEKALTQPPATKRMTGPQEAK